MEKKITLITSSSDGIGKETAKELAAKGYRIIMHGRNPEKTRLLAQRCNKQVATMTWITSLAT